MKDKTTQKREVPQARAHSSATPVYEAPRLCSSVSVGGPVPEEPSLF